MKSVVMKEIFELPPAEKIRLAKEILESITDNAPQLAEWQKKIIDERLTYAEKNPNATITWKEIKTGLKRRGASKR